MHISKEILPTPNQSKDINKSCMKTGCTVLSCTSYGIAGSAYSGYHIPLRCNTKCGELQLQADVVEDVNYHNKFLTASRMKEGKILKNEK